jgi:hypothetical protein
MPKVAIVCDDYKEEMFKEELTKADILYTTTPPSNKIVVFTCYAEQDVVKPIVDKVTQFFIDKYKNEN